MSDDIVARLRDPSLGSPRWMDTMAEAADYIEAHRKRIASLEAKITKLKAEAKLWWDENFKKQTACEQMGKRITELEAALKRIEDTDPDEGTQWFHEVARAALEGGNDE